MIVGSWSAVRGLTLACVLTLIACQGAEEPAAARLGGGLPEGHPPIEQTRPPTGPRTGPTDGPVGVVLETMDAGGYTYARVASLGEEIWTAGPQTPLSLGDSIVLAGATGMTDFTSDALGRRFDSILFLDAFLAPAPDTSPRARGTVLEAMHVAGYTYVRVDADGESIWIAGPHTEVNEGEVVSWTPGPVMRDFESTTLGRTFEAIVFAGALSVIE